LREAILLNSAESLTGTSLGTASRSLQLFTAIAKAAQPDALSRMKICILMPATTLGLRHKTKSPDVSIRALQFGGEGGIRTLILVHYSTNITFNFNNLRNYL